MLPTLLEDAESVVADWQQEVFNCMWSPVLPDGREISPLIPDSTDIVHVVSLVVEGPNITTTAMGFASFIRSKLAGLPVDLLPEGVKINTNFDLRNIFHSVRTFD